MQTFPFDIYNIIKYSVTYHLSNKKLKRGSELAILGID